ncbi:MAG: dephospho-CoA kinase [Prevotella sp.]|nr:dephospho-CoA kinase [Prevotella sp.]
MRIGITGGIGSGKSYVCRLLARHGIEVYDCDAAAKRLMRTSPRLRQQLTELIGPQAYDSANGQQLNKAAVAQFLLASEDNAQAIDAIVHPAVFDDFLQSGQQWVESAILYESGLDRLVDKVVVVTAPDEVRIDRIVRRDGITAEKARQWLNRQWPQELVRQKADFEIVNDGATPLNDQIDALLQSVGAGDAI